MNKSTQKKVRVGFELLVEQVSGRFVRVGHLFPTRLSAEAYREVEHETLPYRIKGIRLSCEKMGSYLDRGAQK